MPIRASAVGAEYAPRDLTLSARALLSFAAGLNIDWPQLLDDNRVGGIVGFPTWCSSLEFNAFGASASAGANPVGYLPEEAQRGVHAGQDTVFHRPFRPGQSLRTTGVIAAARSSSAGAVLTVKAETVSLDDGRPVCTSWISQLFRGLALEGEPRAVENPPAEPALFATGKPSHRLVVQVPRTWPHIYAECSDIWNPIHSEREIAVGAGLKDIIFQGSATWGLAAREIVEVFCDRDVTRLKRLATRFAGMVYPGDELAIELFAPVDGVVAFHVANQDGAPILKNGFAEIA